MLTRLSPCMCCPLWCTRCTLLFLHQATFGAFSLGIFPQTISSTVSRHVSRSLSNRQRREKSSCAARSELNSQASCQDSCTHLEDLQPEPRGASEERLMHWYRCLTWEMKQEEAQMGKARGDRRSVHTGDGDNGHVTVNKERKQTLLCRRCSGC